VSASDHRRVLGNFAALVTGEGLGRAFGLVVTIYLARTLGVTGFGLVETAFAVLVYLQLIVDGGLNMVATRSVARAPHLAPKFASNLLGIRLVVAALLLAGIGVFTVLVNRPASLEGMLVRLSLAVIPFAFSVAWAFQATERMRAVAAGYAITQAMYLVFVVWFVPDASAASVVPLAYVGALSIATLAMQAWYVRRFGLALPAVDLVFWRGIVAQAWPIAITRVLRGVSFNFDVLLLGYFYSERLVGWYAAAYRLLTVPLVFYAHAFTAIFPSLVRLPPSKRPSSLYFYVSLAAASGVVLAGGLSMFARPAITLVMGEAFAEGAPALSVLAWSLPITAVGGVLRQALVSADRQRADAIIVAIAAVVNAGLNVVLIPRAGLIGAAIATLVGEVVLLIGGLVAVRVSGALYGPVLQPVADPEEDIEP